MLNNIGRPATLTVRCGVTQDDYGNDVPLMASIGLENVFVYTDGGSTVGSVGNYLEVERESIALLPIGTAARLDAKFGGHSLAGATLKQDGITYKVKGSPLPYPSGTESFSWEWTVPLSAVTG